MQADLDGKVALVTGSARGIGLGIANRFARSGATVILADKDQGELDRVTDNRARTVPVLLDVTDSVAVQRTVDDIVGQYGQLDILVNNAGINTLADRVTVDRFPREEWDRVMAVDLHAVFELSRAAASVMRKQRNGRIINIASVVGLVPLRLQIAFAAAKAAVVNLTRAMAIELGEHGILVNGIAPGSTLTDATRQLFYGEDGTYRAQAKRLVDHIPLGRPASIDEIAVAALFLADPENSYMNGHVLVVDGGWTAGYHRDF